MEKNEIRAEIDALLDGFSAEALVQLLQLLRGLSADSAGEKAGD